MNNAPKDGDFAKFLEQRTQQAPKPTEPNEAEADAEAEAGFSLPAYEARLAAEEQAAFEEEASRQEQIAATQDLPPLTEAELEAQALAHGGLDDNPDTPE
jgi:hypothetical protein